MIITKPYHREVIKNLFRIAGYEKRPFSIFVIRVLQLFPEYRDESIREQVLTDLKFISSL